MDTNETMIAALAGRAFLYKYLWRAFAGEPDQAFLDVAASQDAAEAFSVFAGDSSSAVQHQRMIGEFAETADLDALCSEYTKLFIGPGKLPAPPWESVYVYGEDLLFQESTVEVRLDYRAAGYQASGYPHEADDHLAKELGFMSALSEEAQRAFEQGDGESFRQAMSRQLLFLGKHLNSWLPKFAERFESAEKPKVGPFYHEFVALAVAVCAQDAENIEELMNA